MAVLAAGCTKAGASESADSKSAGENRVDPAAVASPGMRTIHVSEDGFSPSHIEVKRGSQVTLRFQRTAEQTCAKDVAFPELGITKELPLNQPVDIQIPTTEARILTFQCGMGMYKSKVVVL